MFKSLYSHGLPGQCLCTCHHPLTKPSTSTPLSPISPPTTQLCIKCADLSSLGAANGVYRKWVYRLEDEVRGSLERTEALA